MNRRNRCAHFGKLLQKDFGPVLFWFTLYIRRTCEQGRVIVGLPDGGYDQRVWVRPTEIVGQLQAVCLLVNIRQQQQKVDFKLLRDV